MNIDAQLEQDFLLYGASYEYLQDGVRVRIDPKSITIRIGHARQVPQKVVDFEEAFQLVFEGYKRPADNFATDTAWAIWQHEQLRKAFELMQRVRT